jgi:hypothetical protein
MGATAAAPSPLASLASHIIVGESIAVARKKVSKLVAKIIVDT